MFLASTAASPACSADAATTSSSAAPIANRIDKLYGGEGDDLFRWSPGFNIVHGGQPGLSYAHDGSDVMDYSGAGAINITFNRYWVPHKVPNYVVVFPSGVDHLFSIERIQWNDTTDRVALGKGVDLVEDDVILDRSAYERATGASLAEPAHVRRARLISDDGGPPIVSAVNHMLRPGERNLELVGLALRGEGNGLPNRLLGNTADNILTGNGGDDVLYGGGGDDELIGGPGSDTYVYLVGDGNDAIVDRAAEGEMDQLVLAGGIEPRDVSFLWPARNPSDLLLVLADGGTILIKDFFSSPSSGVERIVFDSAPAWERTDIEHLARAVRFLGDNTHISGNASGQWSDAVTALSPRTIAGSPGDQLPDRGPDTVF